jgi:hypothetical protein
MSKGREREARRSTMGDQRAEFVYLWKYEVRPGREAEFERLYGPNGAWTVFFGRAPAYLGTELLRATEFTLVRGLSP